MQVAKELARSVKPVPLLISRCGAMLALSENDQDPTSFGSVWPGKAVHELVPNQRRELGLPMLPEERILPFRSWLMASLPAIDIAIDQEMDEPSSTRSLALLRNERRVEELEAAVQKAETEDESKHERDYLMQAI